MMQKACSILLVGLLMGCSGSAGSSFGPPRTSNTSDAAGLDVTSDASQEVTVGPALNCPAACPTTEPAPGDPCDLGEDCEYGDSQLIECNRVYFCSLGHFQKWHFDDTSVCGSALPPGCPATRAAVAASCSAAGLRCAYPEGECDCVQSSGATAWHCFPDNPLLGSQVHCAPTRPRLGTSCTAQSVSCQYTPICEAIACSTCGQWAMVPYPCPLGAMPDAGTVTPERDAGTTQDAAPPEAGLTVDAGTRHDAGKDAH